MASGVLCHRSPILPSCVPETYGILICVGIAAGTVRANIPSFGAEQVKLLKILVSGEISLVDDKIKFKKIRGNIKPIGFNILKECKETDFKTV